MAKATVASLAERVHVLEEQVRGLGAMVLEIPGKHRGAAPRPAYVSKTVQPAFVTVTCAKAACHTKGTVPWEDRCGWRCEEHYEILYPNSIP